jgi:sec-independent protein translocase protein TatA
MGMPGPMEIVLIVAVIVLLFGAKKIPELAKGLGQGIKEFKKASQDIKQELNDDREQKSTPSEKE